MFTRLLKYIILTAKYSALGCAFYNYMKTKNTIPSALPPSLTQRASISLARIKAKKSSQRITLVTSLALENKILLIRR